MFPIQRKLVITEYLSQHGGATVKELNELLNVSEMTVRRDLKQLEAEGLVVSSPGGVVLAQSYLGEPAMVDKRARNKDIKEKLASYAVEHFVREGQVIILEGGTTVSRMSAYLHRISPLTILTNGLETLNALRPYSERKTVISCGGTLRERSGTFVGLAAQTFFEEHHADIAFLSALGFTPESGFTDPNLLDTDMKKSMIRSARHTVMLIDSSKFGHRSLATIIHAADVRAVITDKGIPEATQRHLEAQGVDLHIL